MDIVKEISNQLYNFERMYGVQANHIILGVELYNTLKLYNELILTNYNDDLSNKIFGINIEIDLKDVCVLKVGYMEDCPFIAPLE